MPTCLGLYIEKNLIKYAKISKERETTKVEAFGVKSYDKLGATIDQIISETYSYKNAISVNLSDEMYNYFDMFSMLNEKDLKQAIKTEFEFLCDEKGYNKNAIEYRYVTTKDLENDEKVKVLHVSVNKTELARKTQELENYRLSAATPLPMDLQNLLELNSKDNILIVNMEEKTTLTTINAGEIKRIDTLEYGAKQVLDNINIKENSYSKAYEICKNTTIYTTEGLQDEASEYLEDIMPTVYNIVTGVKQVIEQNQLPIDKIYLTGTLSVINNIDLYFQEYFINNTCEILKPYFLPNTLGTINIKEYIEVNSAIALALQGLGEGIKQINFRSAKFTDSFKGSGKKPKSSKTKFDLKSKIKEGFSGAFDSTDFWLLRANLTILFIIVIYIIFSSILTNQINKKYNEASIREQEVNAQISSVENDINKVKKLTANFEKLKQNLIDLNTKLAEKYKSKNAIPNLLNKVMFAMPSSVQVTSIENTINKHIVIKAQAEKYEQLGAFIGTIKQTGILNDVTSDSGIKQNSIVKVTIEGELP